MGIQERKEREKEQRKEEIITAAQKVFFEKGLQSATVDEIAELAELSKGTIYLYYKSKEDLYLAVVMRGLQLMQDMFAEKLRSEPQTLNALLSFVQVYVEFFQEHRNYFRMFQFLQTPQFHKQVSDEMKEAGSRVSRQTWNLAIGLIQRAMDEGLLATDLSAGEAAVILWLSMSALMTRIDTESEMWKTRMNIDLDRVLRLSVALYFDSLLTTNAKKEFAELLKAFHPRFATTR
jgi:TetR/AcrR family transcriptional regulator